MVVCVATAEIVCSGIGAGFHCGNGLDVTVLILSFGRRLFPGHIIDWLDILTAIFRTQTRLLISTFNGCYVSFAHILVLLPELVELFPMLAFDILDLFLVLEFSLLEL